MNSKLITLLGISCLVVSTTTLAWNNSYDNSSNNLYQGSSGNTYQYDMSNQIDRDRYSTDTSAQIRDMTSVNTTRSMDQSRGQYGGGIYDD